MRRLFGQPDLLTLQLFDPCFIRLYDGWAGRLFLEEGVADDTELDGIRNEGGLGLFIRSLIGLDREAAKQALSSFIDGKALTANQIEFIDLVIDHLTERGVLDPRRLYESPFTDIDDQGVSGIFDLGDVKELVKVINNIKIRAAA